MYCPRCATENPEIGKFCRKCGGALPQQIGTEADQALELENQENNKVSPGFNGKHRKKQEKELTWELAMGSLFMGVAFVVISVILAFQPMGAGWWFWLMIPGFMMIGLGVAKIMRITYGGEINPVVSAGNPQPQVAGKEQSSLPPIKTEFVSDVGNFRKDAGDMAPPSVAEGTTRNLETVAEPETKTVEEKPG